jgi:demethylmenaquinone methyltransferase/2-methoxy-6-polyprenyl-1,4-benzoquinol methylase
MGALLARNRSAYTYLPESVENFLTAQDLVAAMEEVGLQKVRYKTMSLGTVAIHMGEKLRQ